MNSPTLFSLAFVSAIGCGLIAGLFFAFSTSVMRALGRLPPAQGMAAMNAINVVIINPVFMLAFFGTAAACFAALILAVLNWSAGGAGWIVGGALLYLGGSIGVTMAFNVPFNNALAAAAAGDESQRVWAAYLTDWTRWNHVRTVASLAAAACLTVGLTQT